MIGAVLLLAGCTIIPKGHVGETPPPAPAPSETGVAQGVLPRDAERHRVALLLPLTGSNAAIGQALANAANMAVLDTGAQTIRITTYDTGTGAGAAAAKAVGDGNKLILGPLVADDVAAVAAVARPARVPMITYSNDTSVAARDVFTLGVAPSESVARVVAFARASGVGRIAALIPNGTYGQRAATALVEAARESGMTITATENYDRGNTSILGAARRVAQAGGFDGLLIADGGRMALAAAPALPHRAKLMGTSLWSGDAALTHSAALRGAWFAALSDARWPRFQTSYAQRFGGTPPRIATLGYDSVLLTLNVARGWHAGTLFPTARLYDKGGFVGIDGAFRFGANGTAERGMEVRRVDAGTFTVVSPAPAGF